MHLKRKLTLFFVGLISFMILFYYHDPGGNVLIFCALAWGLAVYSQGGFKVYRKDGGFWLLSLAMWITAGAFTFYGDPGSMGALLLSFYTLGVYMTDKKFHPLLYPLMLAYSFGSFIVRIFFVERWIPKRKTNAQTPFNEAVTDQMGFTMDPGAESDDSGRPEPAVSWFKTWLLPIIIVLIFLMVYMASSTMFSEVLTKLLPNLDFTVLFALAIIGFILLFNFMYILPIPWLYTINEKVLSWDKGSEMTADVQQKRLHPYRAAHQKGAIITLSLLIGLLSLFLLVYGYELYQGIHAARLSKAIHEQVNSIILSIVMAVAVIMYYIRPATQQQMGYNKGQKSTARSAYNGGEPALLHRLAYVWIMLNILLVISAALHNAAYIGRYGLTLLRIGVYIFLILCIVGLYFTYRKIRDAASAAWLVAIMFKVFLGTIVLNSIINWGAIITRYNLTYMAHPDLQYLRNLDYNTHVLVPSLLKDPRYKNDTKLTEELQNKLDWDASYTHKDILSVAWYYKYVAWQSNRNKSEWAPAKTQ